jgi:hypothetical protein
MKRSNFLKLNTNDFLKGLLMVFITALITGLYEKFQSGIFNFDWETFKPVVMASVSAGFAYLLKNLFTNSQGEPLKTENSQLVKFIKAQKPIAKIMLIGIVLSGLSLSASAQSIWSQFGKNRR